MSNDKIRELETLIRAKYPLLYILSAEEQRVEALLRHVAGERGKKLLGWTVTDGMQDLASTKSVSLDPAVRDPIAVLDWIADSDDNAIFVLKDFHSYMDDTRQPLDPDRALVIRRLRDVVNALKESRKTVVLLSPVCVIPTDLEKDITVLDYARPTAEELHGALERVVRSARHRSVLDLELDEEARGRLVRAAQGLTCTEAENAFAKSLIEHRTLDVEVILEEKKHLLRKAHALEYFVAPEAFSDIGGMDELKEWLRKRGSSFGEAAKRFGLPAPKGLLMLGVQGGGKSLMAKAVARQWHLPLLRLDMGRLYGEMVGASEHNMRQALKVAESVAPCVLWLDEIEKGMAGSVSSGRSDGGTAARVLGTLLTWLQEKESPVFVVATSNDVRQLPPELLRKGRFDEIFFVDLPTESERRDIWRIHLQKRNRDPKTFDLKRLAAETQGFSGAEIEQVLIAALYDAFDEHRDVEMLDMVRVITQTVPLSQTMKKEIDALRKWSKEHARSASGGETQPWEVVSV